jgi:hypothetical protein
MPASLLLPQRIESNLPFDQSQMPDLSLMENISAHYEGADSFVGTALNLADSQSISDFRDEVDRGERSNITPEEANSTYVLNDPNTGENLLHFDKPISRAEAQFKYDNRLLELQYQKQKDRVRGFWANAAGMTAELLAEIRDPLGYAAILMPSFRSGGFLKGFVEGSAAVGVVSAPSAVRGHEMQGEFGYTEGLQMVFAGGLLGGALKKGLQVLGHRLKSDEKDEIDDIIQDLLKEDVGLNPEIDADALQATIGANLSGSPHIPAGDVLAIKDLNEIGDSVRSLREELNRLDSMKSKIRGGRDLDKISPDELEQLTQINLAFKTVKDKLDHLRKTPSTSARVDTYDVEVPVKPKSSSDEGVKATRVSDGDSSDSSGSFEKVSQYLRTRITHALVSIKEQLPKDYKRGDLNKVLNNTVTKDIADSILKDVDEYIGIMHDDFLRVADMTEKEKKAFVYSLIHDVYNYPIDAEKDVFSAIRQSISRLAPRLNAAGESVHLRALRKQQNDSIGVDIDTLVKRQEDAIDPNVLADEVKYAEPSKTAPKGVAKIADHTQLEAMISDTEAQIISAEEDLLNEYASDEHGVSKLVGKQSKEDREATKFLEENQDMRVEDDLAKFNRERAERIKKGLAKSDEIKKQKLAERQANDNTNRDLGECMSNGGGDDVPF